MHIEEDEYAFDYPEKPMFVIEEEDNDPRPTRNLTARRQLDRYMDLKRLRVLLDEPDLEDLD